MRELREVRRQRLLQHVAARLCEVGARVHQGGDGLRGTAWESVTVARVKQEWESVMVCVGECDGGRRERM